MADGFSELIETSNRFFKELAANNEKAWFEPRKSHYVEEIRKPAELLSDILADEIGRLTEQSLKPKLFRIYRDVRFSKDKTPYNPHLHISLLPESDTRPGWHFGSSPEYLTLLTGMHGFKGERLDAYRSMVDQKGDVLCNLIKAAGSQIGAELSDFGADPLKRVPKPYKPDHPHEALLRRNSLIIGATPRLDKGGLVPAVLDCAKALLPFWRFLDNELS